MILEIHNKFWKLLNWLAGDEHFDDIEADRVQIFFDALIIVFFPFFAIVIAISRFRKA